MENDYSEVGVVKIPDKNRYEIVDKEKFFAAIKSGEHTLPNKHGEPVALTIDEIYPVGGKWFYMGTGRIPLRDYPEYDGTDASIESIMFTPAFWRGGPSW